MTFPHSRILYPFEYVIPIRVQVPLDGTSPTKMGRDFRAAVLVEVGVNKLSIKKRAKSRSINGYYQPATALVCLSVYLNLILQLPANLKNDYYGNYYF